jgi:decaprenyl-phosphate phosphoribosyltransferase
MLNYVRLVRPKHWVKNILIFFPLVLSRHWDVANLINAVIGFFSFCMIASGGYILNDIRDIENDRTHAKKINRPLAGAIIDIRKALVLALVLIVTSVALNFFISPKAIGVILFYFCLNYAYSILFKEKRFIDILILSSFYIIRIIYGSVITDTLLTDWFVITITFICLSLSLNKRHMECLISTNTSVSGRNYGKADAEMLSILSIAFGVVSLVFLNLHASLVLGINNPYFFSILNLFGACLLMVYFDVRSDRSDDPVEKLLKNPTILFLVLVLGAAYVYQVWLYK